MDTHPRLRIVDSDGQDVVLVFKFKVSLEEVEGGEGDIAERAVKGNIRIHRERLRVVFPFDCLFLFSVQCGTFLRRRIDLPGELVNGRGFSLATLSGWHVTKTSSAIIFSWGWLRGDVESLFVIVLCHVLSVVVNFLFFNRRLGNTGNLDHARVGSLCGVILVSGKIAFSEFFFLRFNRRQWSSPEDFFLRSQCLQLEFVQSETLAAAQIAQQVRTLVIRWNLENRGVILNARYILSSSLTNLDRRADKVNFLQVCLCQGEHYVRSILLKTRTTRFR